MNSIWGQAHTGFDSLCQCSNIENLCRNVYRKWMVRNGSNSWTGFADHFFAEGTVSAWSAPVFQQMLADVFTSFYFCVSFVIICNYPPPIPPIWPMSLWGKASQILARKNEEKVTSNFRVGKKVFFLLWSPSSCLGTAASSSRWRQHKRVDQVS